MTIALSILLGLLLGLLAGGGSMIAVPIFRYGLGEEPAVAFPGALMVVGIASLIGTVLHARRGAVRWRPGALFASLSMVGAFAGGWVSSFCPDGLHMILFATVLLWTSWKLFRNRAKEPDTELQEEDGIDQRRLVITALGLGALTGFIAIGGGVLVVSALVLILGLPMKEAIGTSLLVITVNAGAGLMGHLNHVDLPWGRLLGIAALAAGGCVLGVSLSQRISTRWLRDALGWLVAAVAVWVLVREFL